MGGTTAAEPLTQELRLSHTILRAAKPFLLGGISGMTATAIIQPMDYVKTQSQLQKKGTPFDVVRSIVQSNHKLQVYSGMSAALMRQATYTTVRLGTFTNLLERRKKQRLSEGTSVTYGDRAICGLTAGAVGGVVSTPTEVALIRMQGDRALPKELRRNYGGIFSGLASIYRDEGVRGLWRGVGPTVARAMALNLGMLATNEQAKAMVSSHLDLHVTDYRVRLLAACASGLIASTFTAPFDMVKTTIQNMPKKEAKSTLVVVRQILTRDGPLGFYKGFLPFVFRISPHAMITLLALDTYSQFFAKI